MKRQLSILAILFLISSCGNTQESIEKTTSNERSVEVLTESVQISSVEEKSIESFSFDVSNLTAKQFFNVSSINLNENEIYNLPKLANENVDVSNLNYVCSIPNNISVSNDGVLTGLSVDNQDEIDGKLYVYDTNNYQVIDVSILDYEEYGNYFMSVDIARLYNKKVMFFGDSITHNWAKYPNGDDSVVNNTTSLGYNYHYIPILNNQCHLSKVINAAWSGGTMAYLPKSPERFTYKSFPGAVENNIDQIADMDYIFVFYGTNDLTDQIDIGNDRDEMTINQTNNGSFKAGMKYGIERIRQVSPQAKIIFINILFRTYPYNGQNTLADYNQAIEDFCLAYNCKLLDVSTLFSKANMSTYSKDGLHPNEKGYKVLSDYIMYGMDGVTYE